MSRNLDPKCKRCRRAGEKLFLKGERCHGQKCSMIQRPYPPGMHGQKPGRLSQYAIQLKEKQKLKNIYGILDRQFQNYFDKAFAKEGVTSENLFKLLETRLDNVVYRSGLAPSRSAARQIVGHGHICVDGHRVNKCSMAVKGGNIITIAPNKSKNSYFSELRKNISEKNLTAWISLDPKLLEVKVTGMPQEVDFEGNIDAQLIVELCS